MYECKHWQPHITVATVVEQDHQFLMVEEYSSSGLLVLNQPAGHIERGESIMQAAVRETLEETGYEVEPTHLVRIERWHKPHSDDTFFRYTLSAKVIQFHKDQPLDNGIQRALWMSRNDFIAQRTRLRSPMVEQTIEDYLNGHRYPLAILSER